MLDYKFKCPEYAGWQSQGASGGVRHRQLIHTPYTF